MWKELVIKMVEKNIYKKKKERKFLRILLLIIFLSLMIFLYFYLVNLAINPFLVILMLAFICLIIIGSFFMKKRKKSIYSELFPDKKRNTIQRPPRKIELKIQTESKVFEKPKLRDVNLDFKYRKTLINKCENCGMIITSYKKHCPICGNSIELKELIKKCRSCGMTNPKSTKNCPICGTRTI